MLFFTIAIHVAPTYYPGRFRVKTTSGGEPEAPRRRRVLSFADAEQ